MEGVISYLRTAAEIKSLLAMGIKKVINLLSSKKIRVRLQPLLQHFLFEKKNDSAYLERIGDRIMAWQKNAERRTAE